MILSFAFFNITSNKTATKTPIANEFNEETDSFGNIRSYTTKMNKDGNLVTEEKVFINDEKI